MKIPDIVKQAVRLREQKLRQEALDKLPPRPKCWYMADAWKYHDHDANGNCILKNHSRDEVHKSPTGGIWIRRTK